jgi:predicted metalloprotease
MLRAVPSTLDGGSINTMRWQNLPTSRNVRDLRGRGGRMAVGGGLGCGGLLLVLLVSWLTGADPLALLDAVGGGQATVEEGTGDVGGPPTDVLGEFASKVLGSTEVVWGEVLPRHGHPYREPTLNLFSGQVSSACGFASAAMGPFYCPADQSVYLDLQFFDDLERRFGAPGDFAQAYVIAHEIGHHIQNLLGISSEVRALQQQTDREGANQLSVALELQADCLAGVWGHYANREGVIQPGDFDEGLRAAAAIGDDTIQRRGRGYVVPESFTHGSAEQRMAWLHRGLETGDPTACDTFGGG